MRSVIEHLRATHFPLFTPLEYRPGTIANSALNYDSDKDMQVINFSLIKSLEILELSAIPGQPARLVRVPDSTLQS
jgi:hypothetical protein